MGTILAEAVIDKAEILLRDKGNTQWDADDLLGWLNDGQRQIVAFKDDAYVVSSAVQLSGGTEQSTPAGTNLMLDITQNMGTDGATPGAAITYIKRRDLDMERPGWHTDTAAATVEHWTYDQRFPDIFWVYPPQPSSSQGYVQMVRSAVPDDIASGAAITVSDIYSMALIEYILFRAYGRESKPNIQSQRSQMHWQAFLRSLGIKEQREQASDPSPQKLTEVSEP